MDAVKGDGDSGSAPAPGGGSAGGLKPWTGNGGIKPPDDVDLSEQIQEQKDALADELAKIREEAQALWTAHLPTTGYSCDRSVVVYGAVLDFCFDRWLDVLANIGAVIVAVAYVVALLIVLR